MDKNLSNNKKMITKIMMIKCILCKKIIKNTLIINMINKKTLLWPLVIH